MNITTGHIWTDGQPVGYTNWDVAQPDSYNGLEACVEMDPVTGRWSDADCSTKKSFFCKKSRGNLKLCLKFFYIFPLF